MIKSKFYVFKDTNKEELKVLRSRSQKINLPLNKELQQIALQMKDYVEYSKDEEKLKEHPDIMKAYGIAAPQMGHLWRMFYISVPKNYNALEVKDEEKDDDKHIKHLLINPILISYKNIFGAFMDGENCLSVPIDHPGIVKRSIWIKMKGYSLFQENEIILEAKGRFAIILLHELDHLNGILYYDRISKKNEDLQNIKYKY